MEDKKSFLIYKDWKKDFADMTVEERGEMITAIFEFQCSGEIAEFNDRFLNSVIRKYIGIFQTDDEKWESIREKRSEAGKLGGRPRKEESKKSKRFSEKAKKAVNSNMLSVNSELSSVNSEEEGVNSNSIELCSQYQGDLLSSSQIDTIKSWQVDDGMIEFAISLAKDQGIYSLAYVDKIIGRWEREGINTVAKARAEHKKWKDSKKPKSEPTEPVNRNLLGGTEEEVEAESIRLFEEGMAYFNSIAEKNKNKEK